MKDEMLRAYRTYETIDKYTLASKQRSRQIRALYQSNKQYFGKNVLDIACGGGILGFMIEPLGIRYTGVDINPDMIKAARKYAKALNSKNSFILKDATNSKMSGNFDTVTIIGNAIGHISTNEFLDMLNNIEGVVHKGSYLIVDYRDVMDMVSKRLWKDHYKNKEIDTHTLGADTINGAMLRAGYVIKTKKKIKFDHKIWAPFIIEPLMRSHGWGLIKRSKSKRWSGWLDVYKRLASTTK